MARTRIFLTLVIAALPLLTVCALRAQGDHWSATELDAIASLSLRQLDRIPVDRTNRVADDPRAVALGRRLFFDQRLSSTGAVSCATCHDPLRDFQDGVPLAAGVGTTNRRTMPIAATAFSPFLFWDGRKDSLWAQALGPLESAVEHGGSRAQYAHVVARHHAADYEALFGPLPNLATVPESAGPVDDPGAAAAWKAMSATDRDNVTRVFVNIGKSLAAFERTIGYKPSRFDRYADALVDGDGRAAPGLTPDEVAGLRLFIGKASCTNCHNGPLLTNQEFHNTGVPTRGRASDRGRLGGADAVLADEFNCRSRWSDNRAACDELEYLVTRDPTLERAFKVPSLRNVARRAPYMHAGQFDTLSAVIQHYDRAPKAPAGRTELKPLRLTQSERRQIEAFLGTLTEQVP